MAPTIPPTIIDTSLTVPRLLDDVVDSWVVVTTPGPPGVVVTCPGVVCVVGKMFEDVTGKLCVDDSVPGEAPDTCVTGTEGAVEPAVTSEFADTVVESPSGRLCVRVVEISFMHVAAELS